MRIQGVEMWREGRRSGDLWKISWRWGEEGCTWEEEGPLMGERERMTGT